MQFVLQYFALNIGWSGITHSALVAQIIAMQESGEIDKDRCMAPKTLAEGLRKKLKNQVPDGRLKNWYWLILVKL